jgi:alpha-tubulin suppressor-like RCC1 family protein
MMIRRLLPLILLAACTETRLVAPVEVSHLDAGTDTLVLSPGESLSVRVVPRDEAGNQLYDRVITFSSSAPGTATVDSVGKVIGVAAGAAQLRFASEDALDSLPVRVVTSWIGGALGNPDGASCLLRPDRRAWCWGPPVGNSGLIAPLVSTLEFRELDAGYHHVCGLGTDSTGWCWGHNDGGELLDVPFHSGALEPVQQMPGSKFISLGGGSEHTCGVLTDSTGYCWGRNSEGQLGDSTTNTSLTPREVQGGHNWRVIRGGDGGSCGLDGAGIVWCWGWDYGFADPPYTSYPTQVLGLPALVSLSVGGNYACGLTAAGAAWCWGSDYEGETGHTSAPAAAPVETSVLFSALEAGYSYTCGLDQDGTAWCWGYGGFTGDGTHEHHRTPTPVLGGHRFEKLIGGWSGFCGFTSGGAAWCWGDLMLWNDQALVPRRVRDP